MKALVITTIAMVSSLLLQAQSLTPFVIGSSGASFVSPNGSLSWTAGELLTATYKTTNYLTQGFHQPTSILVTGIQNGGEEILVVYPNPVKNILHVQASQPGTYDIELFNPQGQRLISKQAIIDDVRGTHQIDVLEIPVALYILRTTSSSTGAVFYHKIEKH